MSEINQREELYTTGEVAGLCGVSVRTVQYYDTRGILTPSMLSEGGRRLYTEADLQRMRVICFLRDAGMSINNISRLFADGDTNTAEVISILIEQQEALIRAEVRERQAQLDKLDTIRRAIRGAECFSVESIGDIAYFMQSRKKLYRMRTMMLIVGILVEVLELSTALLWALKGIWWPFVAVALPVTVVFGVAVSLFYFKRVAYICPECHTVFKPKLRQAFFANHTPTARKLTCTGCGHKGFCVETYDERQHPRAEL